MLEKCSRRESILHEPWWRQALQRRGMRQVRSVFHELLCQAWRRKEVPSSRLYEGGPWQDSILCFSKSRCVVNRAIPISNNISSSRFVLVFQHGGGIRCKLEGCNRVAIGKAQLCRAHGGGASRKVPVPHYTFSHPMQNG